MVSNQSKKPGGLYRINPSTKNVELALPFNDFHTSFAPRLAINAAKDQLYFLKKDIFTLSITATHLPNVPLIEANGRDLYALDIHPETAEIYVGDSGTFSQRGTVYIYNKNGQELKQFKAGVGINGFYFK